MPDFAILLTASLLLLVFGAGVWLVLHEPPASPTPGEKEEPRASRAEHEAWSPSTR